MESPSRAHPAMPHRRSAPSQFGFGIYMGLKQRREAMEAAAKVVIEQGAGSEQLRKALAVSRGQGGAGRGLVQGMLGSGVVKGIEKWGAGCGASVGCGAQQQPCTLCCC